MKTTPQSSTATQKPPQLPTGGPPGREAAGQLPPGAEAGEPHPLVHRVLDEKIALQAAPHAVQCQLAWVWDLDASSSYRQLKAHVLEWLSVCSVQPWFTADFGRSPGSGTIASTFWKVPCRLLTGPHFCGCCNLDLISKGAPLFDTDAAAAAAADLGMHGPKGC